MPNLRSAQVTNSALSSKQLLEKHFRELRNGLCETLDNRLDELVSEVNKIENTSLEPLIESEELIQRNLQIAADIMDEGKEVKFLNSMRPQGTSCL